jgi:hypothetical protein
MRIVGRDGKLGEPLAGLPPIVARAASAACSTWCSTRSSPATGLIYWSYAEPAADGDGNSTAVARGRLDGDASSLTCR